MDNSALAAAALAKLVEADQTIAFAESLTGGALCSAFVDTAGASAAVKGGVVTYALESKHTILGVPAGILAERGAVDPDVVEAMALGAARLFEADFGIATTGLAGPDAEPGKPVGTVYVGAYFAGRLEHRLCQFEGDRDSVRSQAVAAAIELLAELL
ncbi:MAG: CinA family protein [Microbacteriaceae bacterium]|nr:CinA family protein [Microbacteriaceae bacterium]